MSLLPGAVLVSVARVLETKEKQYFSTVALTYKCAYAIVDLKTILYNKCTLPREIRLCEMVPFNSNTIRTYVPSRFTTTLYSLILKDSS